MQLSMQGIINITTLKENINKLKDDSGIRKLVMPTIDIFYTSISASSREQLKQKLNSLGIRGDNYSAILDSYQKIQIQHVTNCIDAIVIMLQKLIQDKSITDVYINKLIDFIEYEQLSIIATDIDSVDLDKMNPAIKFRLIYCLIEYIYMSLSLFRNGLNIIATQDFDQNILKKIDKITLESVQNAEKRQHLHPLFFSELQIREASILALGELIRNDQLSDIFIVYKTASFGLSNLRTHNNTVSYYNLAVKTLSQLSKASSFMQMRTPDQHLTVVIQPVSQETAIGHHGLVRRSIFGVNITYQDTDGMVLDVNTSPGFNHVYRVEPTYKLNGHLKIAYLSHIRKLTTQLSDDPKHEHARRRQEKLTALEHIMLADNQGNLCPATFEQAQTQKPYLFSAWGESQTEKLIKSAIDDLKVMMWRKAASDKHCIGQSGYSILDENLVNQLSDKYFSFTLSKSYDVNKKITDMLAIDVARNDKAGYELWRYDKKMALEIILIAHTQQLLHPAVFNKLEKIYPMMYARSLCSFRSSEVELLILEVKKNILSLLWDEAANEVSYNSQQHLVINHV